ncbi:conserved hypothetical protein [Histoplasma capsulatum var. duboisii H88]|uniref:Uncharacterized protein n=1 Tax=Ajellomyces capsulatus (strain H88) TaxID=544711 RepID=F0UBH7_AJEC8|nr:conserved hypothetical protein [Histoplasma capsulatum var. duboisii H88]
MKYCWRPGARISLSTHGSWASIQNDLNMDGFDAGGGLALCCSGEQLIFSSRAEVVKKVLPTSSAQYWQRVCLSWTCYSLQTSRGPFNLLFYRSASSTSSTRTPRLRRSSGFEDIRTASPALGHRRSSIARFATQLATVEPEPEVGRAAVPQSPPLEARSAGYHTTYQSSLQHSGESFWPRRTNRISSRTASAILWALEEAIRHPFIFTPDLSEINASMSELVGGSVPSGSTGNGRPQNGTSRPAPGPIAGQSNPPSSVRTPTDIMRQRRDREARKKAEQEARERDKQETEWRLQQEQELQQQQIQQFPQPGRHIPAAGAAVEPTSGQPRQGGGVTTQDQSSRHDRTGGLSTSRIPTASAPVGTSSGMQPVVPSGTRQQATAPDSRLTGDGAQQPQTSRQRGPSISQQHQRPAPASSQLSARATTGAFVQPTTSSSQARPQTMSTQAPPQPGEPRISQNQQTEPPLQSSQQTRTHSQQQQSRQRAAFPHAFERWETLSSHWEGLTGYWIRRLEQNNDELSRDPLNQQMSRQITDLSAAGANLFHAVVELQRLRASSERKFQRWFFDTRAEQERAQEVQADLERLLRNERQARAEATNSIAKVETDKLRAEELIREMRRELQISKEEARRAWEELGRREQEERDRTISLRNGEPTIVGGVQVVPMMQSALSRQTSTNRPPTREGPYPGGPGPTSMGGQARQDVPEPSEHYVYDNQVSSPTATDPFVETTREHGFPSHHAIGSSPPRQPPTSAAAMSAARIATTQTLAAASSSPYSQSHLAEDTHGRFYEHESSALQRSDHKTNTADEGSYVPTSEPGGSDLGSEEYDLPDAAYRRNQQDRDRRIVYPRTISDDSDDYENMERMPEGEFGQRFDGMTGIEYGSGPPGSSPEEIHGAGYDPSVDYSGSGWGGGGSGSTWDSVTPRHRHPTRLSDVLEEDERSRTSPSRASQASRGGGQWSEESAFVVFNGFHATNSDSPPSSSSSRHQFRIFAYPTGTCISRTLPHLV